MDTFFRTMDSKKSDKKQTQQINNADICKNLKEEYEKCRKVLLCAEIYTNLVEYKCKI